MRRIMKREYDLIGSVIYREKLIVNIIVWSITATAHIKRSV